MPIGDGLGEVQRRVLWAAGTVGYELALKRIMNVPEATTEPAGKKPKGKSRSISPDASSAGSHRPQFREVVRPRPGDLRHGVARCPRFSGSCTDLALP